jgi:anti-sigma B factor antagonist
LRIHSEIDGDTLRVALVGEFDMGEVAAFRTAVDEAHEPWRRLVVELGDVVFIDSSGLQELLSLDDRLRERGLEMSLAKPSVPVLRLLELTGLDSHFAVRE